MISKPGLIIFYLLLVQLNYGQNENRFWYFGQKAGLDFNGVTPTALTNGQILANEGCVAVADASGNLLFYTSGDTIWNKLHQVMANGTGINSGNSNTQNACVIKAPGTTNQYYLFTLSAGNASFIDTLYYSLIDMSLAAGNGSVITKNTLLKAGCDQKMTVIEHCNKKDAWLVVHQSNSATFLSFLVSTSGVSNTAIASPSGILGNVIGQMKIAPNGKKLAMANGTTLPKLTLYDFNTQTGLVSNSLALTVNSSTSSSAYGCEFSADASKLYCSDYGYAQMNSGIYEWNLCAGSNSAVVNSVQSFTTAAFLRFFGMQLGSDEKIYIANNSYSLDVISQPNLAMPLNGISLNNLNLGGRKAMWGLPNRIIAKKPIPVNITYSQSPAPMCNSYTFFMTNTATNCMGSNYTGFSWNFNDPSSGSANTSSINNATHNFSAPGNYTVLLLLNTPCSTDTLKQVIGVNTPSLNVTGNVTLCPFQSCTLNVSGANSYTWSNGLQSNSVVLNPSVTTQYTISGTSSLTSCISTKTLTLIVNKCLQLTQEAEEPDVFTVFPNPANESVQVNSTVNLPITYVLLNQMGDIIWQGSKQSATFLLDLKNLQAGMYVLYLNNNKTTARVKLLKL